MIAEKTGWTYDYILWGVSWVNLRMMLADAPNTKKVKKEIKVYEGDELAKIMGL